MKKFKIGDVVKPLPGEDGYLHPYLIAGKNYTVEGHTSNGWVNVSGEFRGDGDGYGWDEDWFELVEESAVKAQIGDKVRLVNKPVWVGVYKEGDTGKVVKTDEKGYYATEGYVLVRLDKGFKRIYSIPHGQYEVIQDVDSTENKGTPQDILSAVNTVLSVNSIEEPSAESLRNSILNVREQRNTLLMEITALDKEEVELVEKLKQQGFVLYEQNEPETLATEKKAVLHAEDIEEDMTDPKNWKVGDVIECINRWLAPVGTLDVIQSVDDTYLYRTTGDYCSFDTAAGLWKFHSRPIK